MFAYGVLIFKMLTGEMPFETKVSSLKLGATYDEIREFGMFDSFWESWKA